MYNLLPRLIKKVIKLGSIFLFRNSSLTYVKLNCVQKYPIFSVVDVKEAIEEKPAAEEESRQMKQAVVQSVSMSVATLSRLLSTSQEAALSITSCDTLALSGLLFENCAGQSASSLFIDSSSSVSLTTPIASSFSVCSSPRSSVNGDISTVFLPHAASITIDSCQCLNTNSTLQEGTTSESTLSITSKKTITVTGLGSARSLMGMQSTAQSFAHLTDGSLLLTSLGFTETASQIGVSRQKSFFDVKGGSLRPESVEFVPLSFSGTSSFVKMSGASTLSLKSVSFLSMKYEASGDVVMKSVSISTAGMTGSHEEFLEGQDVGIVISDDWTRFWDHGKCGQERLPCSSLDFAFSLLTHTKTEISLGSNITLSTFLECPETVSARCERKHTDPLQHSDDHDPPSAAHTASLFKIEMGVPFLLALRCDIWDSEDRIRNGTDSLNHTTDIISVRSEWRNDSLLDSLKWIVQISSIQIKAIQI
ncbi:hypothetical protein BLNAU_3690 [Blattamonas nauphoetae]|uniref:Uncharacterized protein n=1 Tax=Blattamonas nauphoetae TaxID=2049346 RepID=A0ABQ9YBY1_9EUKA|nr:hypothetical protein BLNAU_3690 [Blattamonas nauphoetae]